MTVLLVRRLAVRCLAARGGEARALAVRARLLRVAGGPLGAAVDRALGEGSYDVVLPRVDVALDLDPDDYDDDTLAVLWADRIVAALAPHLRGRPDPVAAWVASVRRLAPAEALALAVALAERAEVLAGLYAALSPSARDEVLALLHRAATAPAAGAPAPAAPGITPATAAPGSPPAPTTPAPPAALPPVPTTPPRVPPAAGPADAPGGLAAWLAAWRRAAARARPATPPAPVAAAAEAAVALIPATRRQGEAWTSACGGLVLLYPWLAAYATAAVEGHPDAVPEDVRRVALAALLDASQHDPLVRLLAGVAPASRTPHAEADVDPEPVLRAFAALLPGFEASSPEYLRAHLLVRPATIEDAGDAMLVRLAPMPLDLLLRSLPYPLGVVRLPWTPPLAVRL